jgi:hypothetical protein
MAWSFYELEKKREAPLFLSQVLLGQDRDRVDVTQFQIRGTQDKLEGSAWIACACCAR